MKDLWQKISNWINSKGGWEHCLVISYGALFLWFKMSPAFQTVVLNIWSHFPSLVKSLVEAVAQILAIYGITGATSVGVKTLLASRSKPLISLK